MNPLLADLTPAQREAVTHTEGPLLVVAAAGSGKTRVITRRVAYLIQQGVPPSQILALTFTNKAAREMQDRILQLVHGQKIVIGTFHAVCARLLRQYAPKLGFDPSFTIYDQDDRLKAIRDVMRSAGLDAAGVTPERVESLISYAKNKLWSPQMIVSQRQGDHLAAIASKVFVLYQERLRQSGAMDFDDLLTHMVTLLREHPDVRQALDHRFQYILVDEYQDTNLPQYAIIRGLAVDSNNLCVTGDPDQSIYGWRGANIHNILDFERDFPGARVILLERNYRSTKNILHAADHLIRFNSKRKHKQLLTQNPQGDPVRLCIYGTEQDEARGIASRIIQCVNDGEFTYRDVAVFCRMTALTRALELAFRQAQIPYKIVGGVSFYERQEIKDLLAYISLIVNPRDDLAFLRVINIPARGLGDASLKKLRDHAAQHACPLLDAAAHANDVPGLQARAALAFQNFAALIRQLQGGAHASAEAVIRLLLDRTGYLDHLRALDDAGGERRANVDELVSAAAQFDREHPDGGILGFLENVRLETSLDRWDDSAGAVALMTLHAAKGLEFPVVFIVALEQGILPHARSSESQSELEEERRLLFVGMTRAEKLLFLSHAMMREFRGQQSSTIPSQFLRELPDSIHVEDQSGFGRTTRQAFIPPPVRPHRPPLAAGRILTGAELFGTTQEPPDSAVSAPRQVPAATLDGFQVGATVLHPQYGVGRLTAIEGAGPDRKGRVHFAVAGERLFILARSPLRVLSPGAPLARPGTRERS
jgi:DNA helicase-2/ATP-dependent DNA helicase PcrA